jgi:AraC-like DNA-binding protein
MRVQATGEDARALGKTRHDARASRCHNPGMERQATATTHGILETGSEARFELTRHPPAEDLADYVERHWVVRWNLGPSGRFTQELLPHPCVNLVTEAGGVAVHGIPLARSKHPLEGSGMVVGTKFRPGAFSAFTGVPARELMGRSMRLPAVFGEDGAALERVLSGGPPDTQEHVAAVEELLRRRLPPPDRRLDLLRAIVADMLEADWDGGVAALARRHAVSESTLQRLFREYVGVSPKWVLKRYRVHEAAERIASGEAPARLAADLGYFDQPHFIQDFTAQVGVSPGSYARACAAARGAAVAA